MQIERIRHQDKENEDESYPEFVERVNTRLEELGTNVMNVQWVHGESDVGVRDWVIITTNALEKTK